MINGTVNGYLFDIVSAISGTADALNTLPKALPTGNITLFGDDARSIGMESFRVIRFITIAIRNISGTLGPGMFSPVFLASPSASSAFLALYFLCLGCLMAEWSCSSCYLGLLARGDN